MAKLIGPGIFDDTAAFDNCGKVRAYEGNDPVQKNVPGWGR